MLWEPGASALWEAEVCALWEPGASALWAADAWPPSSPPAHTTPGVRAKANALAAMMSLPRMCVSLPSQVPGRNRHRDKRDQA
ncbi:hypothetical protein Shyhy02_66220 [Streptomyces hygroscopicus subsp. hygroscopicus]|nr:hypothetical protein Shyhy02_66220 [Streptomyces hygroscopicus subsp. hygroscopicus]